MLRVRAALVSVFALCCAASAQAHDPLQAWSSARLTSAGISLESTIAMSTARLIVGDLAPKNLPMTPENFEEFRGFLEQRGEALFEAYDGDDQLFPDSVVIVLGVEFDVEFRVHFPRPVAGPVGFKAAYLEWLDPGYGTTFTIISPANKELAYDDLFYDRSWIQAELPDLDVATAKAPGPPPLPVNGEPVAAPSLRTKPVETPQEILTPPPAPLPAATPDATPAVKPPKSNSSMLILAGVIFAIAAAAFFFTKSDKT